MNAQQILNAVQESKGVKTIGCVFSTTKYVAGQQRVYTYKTWMDHTVGESVVVETAKGLSVVEVVEVHDTSKIDGTSSIEYKWIVCKVVDNEYTTRTDKDAQDIANINEDLRKQRTAKITERISDDLLKRL